jgi:predicted permease
MRIALIYLACPTAVASFVMAEQMGSDHDLSSGIVVASIFLALPALAIVLII